MKNRSSSWTTALAAVLALAACGGEPPSEPVADAEPGVVHPEIWPEVSSPVELDPEIEAAVDELLAAMTVEEKVGQTIQPQVNSVTPEEAKEYHLGSVLNGGGGWPGNDKYATPADWVALADAFWEASMDTSDGGQAIPIIWGLDAVHGHLGCLRS